MSFSPVLASKKITEKYYRYLKTYFKIGEPYKKGFENLIENGKTFAKGPYLDVTDAFTKGKSISDLIEEGLLPASFSKINMKLTRPLYKHQENAIRKIATYNKNIVVSTGTGSGKTESFLIPILRELAIEAENGTLTPGVRALIIYPMNALANDQTERLRELLADYPQITFGSYTGQTLNFEQEALEEYKKLNNGKTPIPNEIISREKMKNQPPHILITNYAMLEYLMVRPRDSTFFIGEHAGNWKFIVFDEAHVYHGSTGIEVSMLFRRLKTKLGTDNIKYILTSATLGEKENNAQVAEFAQKLCSAQFSEDDIIRADRIIPQKNSAITTLPLSFYANISKAFESLESEEEISKILACNPEEISDTLYEKIVNDSNYWRMRAVLSIPKTVKEITEEMNWTEKQVADFVTTASMAEKNGGKLFDARYHMFLRATDSVFVTLAPDNQIMFNRAEFFCGKNDSNLYKVFEAATCSYCQSVYLIGKIENNRLVQYNRSEDISNKEIFLLSSSISDTDSDNILEDEGIKASAYEICPFCGFLRKAGEKSKCEHYEGSFVTVFRAEFNGESNTLTKCLKCENVNHMGIIRQFFSGQEAATSVIGTALFEELPSYKVTVEKNTIPEDDEFGCGDDFETSKQAKTEVAKQFIAFSDSRQAAAFYSSYLNISYNNILYRRIIAEALNDIPRDGKRNLDIFVDMLESQFKINNIKGKTQLEGDLNYTSEKEAWKAVLAELIDSNSSSSLFRLGFMGIILDTERSYPKYNLCEAEFNSLCTVLISSMITSAAIDVPPKITDNDIEDFTYNGKLYEFSLSDSKAKDRIKSFIPSKPGLSNKRIDYFQKIVAKKGYTISNDEAVKVLTSIWEKILIRFNILVSTKRGTYQVNPAKINVIKPEKWFICKKCKRVTCHNIENVCSAYRCDGELVEFFPEKELSDDHYYKLYTEMEIRDMSVVEHTAQLDKDTAYDYQNKFKENKINILSCSTTFEMGVDVGTLETVFMRNMPPLPSNYAQRAGRAGRSSKSAAFALTFCNKSSHDFSYFNDPVMMIKGRIDPPQYTIENERIALRHLYASSLGYFWKSYPDYFTTMGKFEITDESGMNGFGHLKAYLQSKPRDLKEFLFGFLPAPLAEKYGVENFEWVENLVGEDGVLTKALMIFRDEVSTLEELSDECHRKHRPSDSITRRIKAFNTENILAFLSRKNILPKYGFPVDTVEMSLPVVGNKGFGLQLQRDLSMAISEYAPGSQIVANNNLITSRYIRMVPTIGWKMYSYNQCKDCKTLNIKLYTSDEDSEITECCQCHKTISGNTRTFIIPEQGFVADPKGVKKPGLKKPEKTYRGEMYYVGFRNEVEQKHYNIGNSNIIVMSSKNDEMAVLNTSPFYVCEKCGYSILEKDCVFSKKKKEHKNISGGKCSNDNLKKFSLGYRFLTDVVRITFEDHPIDDFDKGLSILHGFLRGVCSCLNIEENDISGCLQSTFKNGAINYSMVIFDNTPGGSGNAARLDNPSVITAALRRTLSIMQGCVCGGDEGDSSCYSCLRSYRNQKYHDVLKRGYVINFISEVLL